MNELGDAYRAVLALAFGGFMFIVIGSSLSSAMSTTLLINLQLWGVVYIIGAIVLAAGTVYAVVWSILS